VVKSTQALFLGEVLTRTIREEERNPELFDFLSASAKYFETLPEASPSYHILFLFELTRYLGFYPRNSFSEKEIFFNISTGGFSSVPETTDIAYEKALGAQWRACFTSDYHTVDQVFINQEQRNRMLDALLQFYRLHHASSHALRSLEVLRTVFS
jgi:DNA repair protein RecO (recombination protein O)